jgi:hypothetical protein
MRTPPFQLICALALALFCIPVAHGQAVPGQPVPAAPKLTLNMEDEHILKEILLKDTKIKHEPAQPQLKTGDAVPASVELHDFPTAIAEKMPQIKSHRFYLAGDEIVIVRSEERKVVGVVK